MNWIYYCNLPLLEDSRRYTAPDDDDDDDDDELEPYDQGYEDRVCCGERIPPRYRLESSKAEWLRGWDAADSEPEEVGA